MRFAAIDIDDPQGGHQHRHGELPRHQGDPERDRIGRF